MSSVTRIRAIDSHTAGEPTRLIVDGFPDLGNGSMAERLNVFREQYDDLRVATVCEPRGHDADALSFFHNLSCHLRTDGMFLLVRFAVNGNPMLELRFTKFPIQVAVSTDGTGDAGNNDDRYES